MGAIATKSSVVIDRNSGQIRTGGMGLFPNNGARGCEPWSARALLNRQSPRAPVYRVSRFVHH
jgi:hypothetical protein